MQNIGASVQGVWLISGDFNNVLNAEGRIGQPVTGAEVQGFKDMIDNLQLTPLRSKGCFYTWCNKQQGDNRVYSKIDWVFGNFEWLQQNGHIEAEYMQPGISDHSPAVVHCRQQTNLHPKPFRLYVTVMEHPNFKGIVQQVWQRQRGGNAMEILWENLKQLKGEVNMHGFLC
ncbi:hypothetical protein KY285_030647 [Solanum tuberosum]|nr:hypothetical protein KY285_030647 [Solanum tuberosum]